MAGIQNKRNGKRSGARRAASSSDGGGRRDGRSSKREQPEPRRRTLDRVLSKAGLGSRTEARSWIGAGRVTVNGKKVQSPDAWVDPERDRVALDGCLITEREKRYLLLYKPKGYLTTYKDPEGRPTVYDLIRGVAVGPSPATGGASSRYSPALNKAEIGTDTDFASRFFDRAELVPRNLVSVPISAGRTKNESGKPHRNGNRNRSEKPNEAATSLAEDNGNSDWIFPVGRLDQDTTGLLILTNDTAFGDYITSPQSKVPKTYLVKASTVLTDDQLQQLRDGVMLSDGPTRPAIVNRVRNSERYTFFEITITEGRNRQVRRMVEALGAKVLKLVRTRIGSIGIGDLQIGTSRELTKDEVRSLLA